MKLNNLRETKPRRKSLRYNSTLAEATLWEYLKNKQLGGYKFRRQHSIDKFIMDFYNAKKKLCIELDGAAHFTNKGRAYDEFRSGYLASVGIRVIRFENIQVFENIEKVLKVILDELTQPPLPSGDSPLARG